MRIYADITEPARLVHELGRQAVKWDIEVHRTLIHKRAGLAGRARARHPFYGGGADYVVTDAAGAPVAAIERKTMDDLAKSIALAEPGKGPRIFRQLRDLKSHPLPILLLEGPASPRYARIELASLGIQLWCAREGIALITTSSSAVSIAAILLVARRQGSLSPQQKRSIN